MTLLDRLFGRLRKDVKQEDGDMVCRHGSLSPMWENVQDMGDAEKISRYRCLDCGANIPRESAPADATREAA
jgi:hypothetical protein